MSGFRRIISVYLTAAVILGLVIAGFGGDGTAVFGVPENTVTKHTEAQEAVTKEAVSEETATEEAVTESTEPSEYIVTESITEQTEKLTEEETTYKEIITEQYSEDLSEEEDTEPLTSEADTQASEDVITFREILAASPMLHNSYSPKASNEKVKELLFLSETEDSLTSAGSVNVYTFTVTKRSVFSYSFFHAAPKGAEGWEISLYGEYYINGDKGKTAYRLIDTLKTSVLTEDKSPELGLAPGNYRLTVEKGNAFTDKKYEIKANLKESAEYEIECNDNIYRYTEIYSGVPVKGSASCFPDRQDDDYYLLRMYEDGFIDLKFEHPAIKDKVSVCWQVLLFSEDGTCMYSENSLFTDTVNKSGKIGLLKGNYYVLVRNRVYADMTYTLTLSRTDNTDYETEKNDTVKTANLIGTGSTVTGTVASQINGIDRDYFRFNITTNGLAVIDFAHEPIENSNDKNGWNIVLLDEGGNTLYKGISAWADDVTVSSAIGLGKGTYYVRIDSENLHLNSDRYYLTVNFTEDTNSETEFNNTPETADILSERTPVTGNLSERNTDYDTDYYVIDITEKADITVEFSHEKLSGSREIFNFTLMNSKKQPVKCYTEKGDGASVIKSFSDKEKTAAAYKSLPAGRYYVKVTSGIFYSGIQYSLSYVKGE